MFNQKSLKYGIQIFQTVTGLSWMLLPIKHDKFEPISKLIATYLAFTGYHPRMERSLNRSRSKRFRSFGNVMKQSLAELQV